MSEYIPLLMSLWPHALVPAISLLLFTLPPFPFRRLTYLASFITLFYLGFFRSPIPPDWPTIQVELACLWMIYLDWLAKMTLHTPEHDFWRRGRVAHEAERMAFGRDKFIWALTLLTAPRGVGWNHQLKLVQPRERVIGRWQFALRQLLRAVMFSGVSGLLTDLLRKQCATAPRGLRWKTIVAPEIAVKLWADAQVMYALCNAFFLTFGLAEEQKGACWPVPGRVTALLKCLPTLINGLFDIAKGLSTMYKELSRKQEGLSAGAVLIRALALANGHISFDRSFDCLPPFGINITSLDSLQEFWGQFWHQTHRRMFQDYGRAVTWLFGVRPYSLLAGIVQVWTAFIITGTVYGVAISSPFEAEGAISRFWAVFGFFVLQAVGLTLESLFLITPGRDLTLYEIGLEDEMMLGRLWTFGWLLISAYWALDSWFATSWTSLSIFAVLAPLLKRSRRPNRS